MQRPLLRIVRHRYSEESQRLKLRRHNAIQSRHRTRSQNAAGSDRYQAGTKRHEGSSGGNPRCGLRCGTALQTHPRKASDYALRFQRSKLSYPYAYPRALLPNSPINRLTCSSRPANFQRNATLVRWLGSSSGPRVSTPTEGVLRRRRADLNKPHSEYRWCLHLEALDPAYRESSPCSKRHKRRPSPSGVSVRSLSRCP